MEQANQNKADVMSDTDLGQVLATFLKAQEKRDELLRDDIKRVNTIASEAFERSTEALTRIEGSDSKHETAFKLLNKAADSAKTNWGTVLMAIGVVSSLMYSILSPLKTDIGENNGVLQVLMDRQVQMQVDQAVMKTERNWSDDIHALTNDYENRMDRAWVNEGGIIAHPNSNYTPLQKGK